MPQNGAARSTNFSRNPHQAQLSRRFVCEITLGMAIEAVRVDCENPAKAATDKQFDAATTDSEFVLQGSGIDFQCVIDLTLQIQN